MTEELEMQETADEMAEDILGQELIFEKVAEEEAEAKEKAKAKVLPEAPASMNITVYYEGFKIQLTQRDPNTKLMPYVENAMAMIKWAKVQGFKPSWNDDTNGKVAPTDAQRTNGFVESLEAAPVCPYHNKTMSKRQGKFGEFWSCGTKLANGDWCDYKPEKKEVK